jgi:MFS transporter, PPP family, 3-phenylpropionic acid transporter
MSGRTTAPDLAGRRLGMFFGAYFALVGILAPYMPLYFEQRGMTAVQIGLLIALGQAMRMVGPNLWGWLADRSGHRTRILRTTSLALVASFALLFFPGGFGFVFATMVLVNFFQTAQMPVAEALASAQLRGQVDAVTRYGRLRVFGSAAFVAVVLAAGPLFDRVGMQAALWVCIALAIVLLATSLGVIEQRTAELPHERVSVRARLRESRVRWFFVSAALMVFAHGAMYAYLSLYLAQLGYSKTAIGVFWVVSVVLEIAFFLTQGKWFARFGVFPLMTFAFAVAAVRFLLIAELATLWWILVIAQAMHAVTFAVHHSASVLTIQRWFPGQAAARGQALYISMAYGFGGTTGSLVAAWLWSQMGPSWAFGAGSVGAVLGGWAAIRMRRADRDRTQPHPVKLEVDRSVKG